MNDIFTLRTTNTNRVVLIDAEDKDKVLSHHEKWYENKGGHICCRSRITGEKIAMHRLLMGFPLNMDVDHRKGFRSDNRKSELRICTRNQNNTNKSKQRNKSTKFIGVYPSGDKFMAKIRFRYKSTYIGTFNTDIEAAKAYNKKAIEIYGEFASLNKI